jgi:hypothetical protein
MEREVVFSQLLVILTDRYGALSASSAEWRSSDERLTLVFAPGDRSYPLINCEYVVVSTKPGALAGRGRLAGAIGLACRSQAGEKLRLLSCEFLRRENALLVQFGQPFDFGEEVSFLGTVRSIRLACGRRSWFGSIGLHDRQS